MEKLNALVLLSGGVDSTICLAWAKRNLTVVGALFFDYGQVALPSELKAARHFAKKYRVPLRVVDIRGVYKDIGVPMTGNGEIPEGDFGAARVPYRNGIMLSVAAAHAQELGASALVIGTYDNSEDFYDADDKFTKLMELSILRGTNGAVYRVYQPLDDVEEDEKFALAKKLRVDLSQTYSCYVGGEVACGKCPSCKRRKEMFAEHGVKDCMYAE